MMLKDDKARAVLVRSQGNSNELSFVAKEGLELQAVKEAFVCAGDDIFLDEAYIRKVFDDAGFGWVKFTLNPKSDYDSIDVQTRSDYGDSWSRWREEKFWICDKLVGKTTYQEFYKLKETLRRYNYLGFGSIHGNKMNLPIQNVLEIIGAGNIVTPVSLQGGYAKGENRPRLLPGDSVEIQEKKGITDTGTITRMSSKATVLRKNGIKSSIAYDRLKRVESVGYSEDIINGVDLTVRENLSHVLDQKHRIYRAKTEKKDLVSPMFPEPNEHQIELKDTQSCVCPLCGWQMAEFSTWRSSGEFICCFCKASGQIINRTDDEIFLLMNRQPAKNRFAVKEVRCCSNCGGFQFETGRQGKRSTGYCGTTNQCIQGYNTCDYWFPVDAERFSSALRQHVTNLGYGVKDSRNTKRNDIRDTVYRTADHLKEKEHAEKLKAAYTQAYAKFMTDLKNLANQARSYEGTLDEKDTEEWRKILDDGC